MNNSQPRTKVGLIDIELNGITKETTICIVYFFGICIVVALKKCLLSVYVNLYLLIFRND